MVLLGSKRRKPWLREREPCSLRVSLFLTQAGQLSARWSLCDCWEIDPLPACALEKSRWPSEDPRLDKKMSSSINWLTKWFLCETIKSGESLTRHSSRRTINKRGGSITDHEALTVWGAKLCARDSSMKSSCLLRARCIVGVMRVCLVQRVWAALRMRLDCVSRVRSTWL